MTGATCGAGDAHSSGTPDLAFGFCEDALENLEQLQGKRESNADRITFRDEAVKTMRKILQIKQRKAKLVQEEKELDTQIHEADLKKTRRLRTVNTPQYKTALAKRQQLLKVLDCYRLTGISIYSEDENSFILCFDTNYKSKFYESYFVEFIERDDDSLRLKHHSLPPFLPVTWLAEQHLQVDPKPFVMKVSDYLYAYVIRREEVTKVQELITDHSLRVVTTTAVDFVELTLGHTTPELTLGHTTPVSIKVTLTYEELLHVLPKRVTFHTYLDEDIELPGSLDTDQVLKWKQQLKVLPLSEVMVSVIDTWQLIKDRVKEMDDSS